eukprot:CAMPEP_0114341286 /NCGR_PEP_ID=MMETSP0101-20121206/8948_1 /TAXON_ID=38822 ORGANISM="Pteridomonas danica, Strain PT" /NCGR_SAMPLE_ID=MMETSP0101 /ASSEMBLY_ACC=CAM_ASM_000211 /LENGTH=410 /DNA_ID=CAMNT_0001474843 /DNA_START=27 /DNA_END=1256 /DNA_ORIENTATION=-
MAGVTCYTAPGVTFDDRASLQEHYKSDWHRYNLKRKVAGLPPLPNDQFEARKAAALAAKGDQEKKAASHKLDHVKQNKKDKVAGRVADRKERILKMNEEKEKSSMKKPPVPPTKKEEEEEDRMKDDETNENEEEEEEEEEPFEVDLRRSLFDSNLAEDIDESLAHMAKKYGFFIPDVEYLSDLEGLVEYLHEKIGLGHTCLYCNKIHRSANACRQHMVDSSHCKIKYDDQVDMDEISDFYDFSEANATILGEACPKKSSTKTAAAADGDQDDDELNSDDEISIDGKSGVEVMPSGELMLTRSDGSRKTIGVRWLKKYYSQNARVIDERASVVANQRERLANIYRRMGVATDSDLMNQLIAAGPASEQSSALTKAYDRDTRYTHGHELQAARQHFKREQLKNMKLGMNENW